MTSSAEMGHDWEDLSKIHESTLPLEILLAADPPPKSRVWKCRICHEVLMTEYSKAPGGGGVEYGGTGGQIPYCTELRDAAEVLES